MGKSKKETTVSKEPYRHFLMDEVSRLTSLLEVLTEENRNLRHIVEISSPSPQNPQITLSTKPL